MIDLPGDGRDNRGPATARAGAFIATVRDHQGFAAALVDLREIEGPALAGGRRDLRRLAAIIPPAPWSR